MFADFKRQTSTGHKNKCKQAIRAPTTRLLNITDKIGVQQLLPKHDKTLVIDSSGNM